MSFKDGWMPGAGWPPRSMGYKDQQPVVLALPRGGVPVAAEVAAALNAPLDLILVRKIGVPFQPELAMGAVVDGGAPLVVRNEDVISLAGMRKRISTRSESGNSPKSNGGVSAIWRARTCGGCRPDSDRRRRRHRHGGDHARRVTCDPSAQSEEARARGAGGADRQPCGDAPGGRRRGLPRKLYLLWRDRLLLFRFLAGIGRKGDRDTCALSSARPSAAARLRHGPSPLPHFEPEGATSAQDQAAAFAAAQNGRSAARPG